MLCFVIGDEVYNANKWNSTRRQIFWGSSIAMHCLNFGMLGTKRTRQSSASKISIEVDSAEDGSEKIFDTFDRVKGNVLVNVNRKINLEKIDITFEGMQLASTPRFWNYHYIRRSLWLTALVGSSSSSVSRATPFAPGRREAYHPFLWLRQPTDISKYADQNVLLPGKVYKFPFEFVIPEEMLSQCCDHEVKHSNVRKAHKRLPPSFGPGMTRLDQSTGDGMTPQTCQVSYSVRAVMLERPRDDALESTVLCDTSRAVRVLPKRDAETHLEEKPTRPVFKKLQTQSSWMRRKRGQIQLAAEQPEPISLPPLGASTNTSNPTIDLLVSFEPTGKGTSLPQLHRVQSRLKVTTYYCTVPGDDIPGSSDPASTGTDREAYFTTIPLASHNISSLEWESFPSFSVSEKCSEWSGYASGSESTLDLVDFSSRSCFTASSRIPIILPSKRKLVPTFHSCLVSRSYVLELALSYSMPHSLGSSNASLRVPVELV